MAKNLVICCDGTDCEFGDNNSNVVRLYSMLENSGQQMTYYHPGLGTMGSQLASSELGRWWTRMLGLAFGYGLMDHVTSAYIFLMNHYKDLEDHEDVPDNVYLFGFSRGAYTVRALAALLHMFGLIRLGNECLIPYALEMFRARIRNGQPFEVAQHFKSTFSRECKPHFLGVLDTVSSVGWIYDPLKLPYTAHNPDIAVVRHAVSIDERRCAFRQNLWQPQPPQDSKQVWFAGYHTDLGGGYAGLPNITLQWLLREASNAGLRLTAQAQASIPSISQPNDCCAEAHNSMTIYWLPLEIIPRRHWDTRLTPPRYKWHIPLCEPRYIAEGSVLHYSVTQRKEKSGYNPPNLPKTYAVEY